MIYSILFAAILLCGAYALLDGIRCGSILGISLAFGSMGALLICIQLIKKLTQTREEE